MKQTLKLKNLSCQNCVKHVTNHFLDLDGVEEVKIQLDQQLAEVETSVAYDLKRYQEVLDDTIYEVEELV
ncbi:TPA: heavy metal-associated domain-containing protein [Streptococcus suis]|jgi:copper chaperone|uniref:Heavy-metal-associated domain-containing protein n=1 Tax=Streptococcus parasuis TaxID=1501662 RepID=A0A4Q8L1K7_9STRE|nr:heavy metal-associated domain-containing protein [Streptococcus parasuis]MBP6171777.1 heavy-metal-associated domain-containing protein [Streptococcus sp.]MDG3146615.1 heavy-metal-associated domain-containing protein [Streptococcus suis]NCB79443.1 heavy-metal-associated domain-containing protein [Bacilli bacterium]MBP7054147.1 heavy-metal-associated domain-containing protein [Streptococcus sp.]MBP7912520.1 heavy-metal-associated domain-containing protein [Streptococcus sp.]